MKKEKNGLETAVSFDQYEVEPKENGYVVWFWNEKKEENRIKLDMTEIEEEKSVLFTFEYQQEEELFLTLYVGRNDTVLGLPVCKGVEIKKKKKLFRKREKERVYTDRKLSYRIPDRYFFENKNITDYKIDIKDAVYLTIRDKNPSFLLKCQSKKEEIFPKSEKYIKKYPFQSIFIKTKEVKKEKIESWIQKYDTLQGVMIEARTFDRDKIQKEIKIIHDAGLDAIYCLDGTIGEVHKKKYLRNENSFRFGDQYYPDFSKEDTVRAYLVTVRKYLDELADGIYFDGYFSKNTISHLLQGMLTVCKEYEKISVFHSDISEWNRDFGYFIIKNPVIIKNFENLSIYYENSGEKNIGKEENQLTVNNNFYVTILKK